MSWSDQFEDPVPGLKTLRDAARYIQKLPKAQQQLPHWQAAIEALIMAAEGRGPLLHARVGMLRAMHHGKPAPAKEPRRKAVRAYRLACAIPVRCKDCQILLTSRTANSG